jgi:hypothetical protein
MMGGEKTQYQKIKDVSEEGMKKEANKIYHLP